MACITAGSPAPRASVANCASCAPPSCPAPTTSAAAATRLPTAPAPSAPLASAPTGRGWRRHSRAPRAGGGGQDRTQLGLHPPMQHLIGTAGYALHTHLPIRRMKQVQQLGRACTKILMRLAGRLPFGLPVGSRIGPCLEGSGFILRPDGQAFRFALLIGPFN